MQRIALCASPGFVIPFFEKFLNSDKYSVKFVITQKAKKLDKKGNLIQTDIALWAKQKNLLCYEVEKIKEATFLINMLEQLDCVIVFAFGQIIPKLFLNLPKKGWLNIHPSMLPKLRGPSPLQYALLNNYLSTGITLMLMDSKMDEGDIIAQKDFKININHNLNVLLDNLGSQFAFWIEQNVYKFLNNEIQSISQSKNATYSYLITKNMYYIKNESPQEIISKIRAFGYVFLEYNNLQLKCFCAKIATENSLLNINGVEPVYLQKPGKRILHIRNFMNGI